MPRTKKVVSADGTTAETAAVKKTSAKKTAEIYLQTGSQEWNISDWQDRITADYTAAGRKASSIKKLVVYLKPEEGKAYYVVNDADNGSIDL